MLPIYFIWLGSILPSRYQPILQQCKRQYGPCFLLGEKQQDILMKKYGEYDSRHLVIQRADSFRLLQLYQYGGIYIDLDVQINDWNWLKALSCQNVTYFAQQQSFYQRTRYFVVSNWFICSAAKTPQLKRLIDNINHTKIDDVMTHAGPIYLQGQHANPFNSLPMVRHCYDDTWIPGLKIQAKHCAFNSKDIYYYFGTECFEFNMKWFAGFSGIVGGVYLGAFVYWVRKTDRREFKGEEIPENGIELENIAVEE